MNDTIRSAGNGGNNGACREVEAITRLAAADGLLADMRLTKDRSAQEFLAEEFAVTLGRGIADNPSKGARMVEGLAVAAMLAGHPARGDFADNLRDLCAGKAWPDRKDERSTRALAEAEADVDAALAEGDQDGDAARSNLRRCLGNVIECLGRDSDLDLDAEVPALVARARLDASEIPYLLMVGGLGRDERQVRARRAYEAERDDRRAERLARKKAGLSRFETCAINSETGRYVADEGGKAKVDEDRLASALIDSAAMITREKQVGAPIGQLLLVAFESACRTRKYSVDVEGMAVTLAEAAGDISLAAIFERTIAAARDCAGPTDTEAAFSRLLAAEGVAPPFAFAPEAPAGPAEAVASIEATAAPVEVSAAPAAPSDDGLAERRAIARGMASIKAARGRPLDDMLAAVRRFAGEVASISNERLADRIITTSMVLAAYEHDAIRFSVEEVRKAGDGHDDAVVAGRVEKRLSLIYAPLTGDPGATERAAASMSPTGATGPTPFKWVDPGSLPPREWLYGTALIRREITATLAPGGCLKTSLGIAEGLALTSGRPLLGVRPVQRCRVWNWNGEEPMDEMQRRIMAACLHHGLTSEHIDGWLFVDTIDTCDFVIAEQIREGVSINRPRVANLIRWVRENKIDVLMIDPFISTHNVGENDNGAIQQVATAWKEVARGGNCAISLAHHTRKMNGQATTVEDSRGAKSLTDKARIVRPIAPMTKDDAEKLGVPIEERRRYVSIDPTEIKGNMSLGAGGRDWYQSVSVTVGKPAPGNLNKGDSVGVVDRWYPSEKRDDLDDEQVAALGVAMGDKAWRAANNTMDRADTIGAPICKAFGLDQKSQRDRSKAWKLYSRLVGKGILSPVSVTEGYKSFPGARFCNPSA